MPLSDFSDLRLGDPRFNALINPPANNMLMAPLGVPDRNNLLDVLSAFRPHAPALQDRMERSRRGDAGSLMPSRAEIEEATSLFGGPAAITRIPNPIRAYHGSPHRFDEFRMDRIGTGEGAQSYGHGLYFAENEGVARTYRPGQFSLTDTQTQARAYLDAAGGDRQAALARLLADQRRLGHDTAYVQQLESAADLLRSGRDISPGHMYEVRLHARPEQFLDWDNPLRGPGRDALEPFLREARLGRWRGVSNAGDLSDALVRAELRGPNGPQITEALSNAGIPGLRYLDAGSRASGTGTSNYVVWSPEIIEIMRRYGLLGPTAGAAGAVGLLGNRE